tara:strand:+ start:186 stop:425 length:240 start_codon:yes stop_codon:yes gene_type:complete
MREQTNMLPINNLDKFTVRHVGGIVQIAVEVSTARKGSTRPVVRGLSADDARELARRINLAASQARDHALDVDMLPGLI